MTTEPIVTAVLVWLTIGMLTRKPTQHGARDRRKRTFVKRLHEQVDEMLIAAGVLEHVGEAHAAAEGDDELLVGQGDQELAHDRLRIAGERPSVRAVTISTRRTSSSRTIAQTARAITSDAEQLLPGGGFDGEEHRFVSTELRSATRLRGTMEYSRRKLLSSGSRR